MRGDFNANRRIRLKFVVRRHVLHAKALLVWTFQLIISKLNSTLKYVSPTFRWVRELRFYSQLSTKTGEKFPQSIHLSIIKDSREFSAWFSKFHCPVCSGPDDINSLLPEGPSTTGTSFLLHPGWPCRFSAWFLEPNRKLVWVHLGP